MQIFLFVLAVILFIGLVVVHELGHLVVARRNGVEAEEFGIGFPPRAVGKKLKSGMILSLNWLPLGGFVKMKGEHDSDTAPGSFGAASLWSKTKILLAGVTMNLIVGVVLLMILAWVGMPVLLSRDYTGQNQFTVKSDTHITHQEVEAGNVIAGSPASKIGLSYTDVIKIVSGAGKSYHVSSADNLHNITESLAGQQVEITYSHDGQDITKQTTLLTKAEVVASNGSKGYLGIEPNQLTLQRSTWSAPVVAVGFAAQLVWLSLQAIGHAIGGLGSMIAGLVTNNHTAREAGQKQASNQVGGPISVMRLLWDSGSLGVNFMLIFIAIISLTLAIMNVLPIPALDGGRLFMTLISRGLFKKPLTQETEEKIVASGMVLILVLILAVSILDIRRSF